MVLLIDDSIDLSLGLLLLSELLALLAAQFALLGLLSGAFRFRLLNYNRSVGGFLGSFTSGFLGSLGSLFNLLLAARSEKFAFRLRGEEIVERRVSAFVFLLVATTAKEVGKRVVDGRSLLMRLRLFFWLFLCGLGCCCL